MNPNIGEVPTSGTTTTTEEMEEVLTKQMKEEPKPNCKCKIHIDNRPDGLTCYCPEKLCPCNKNND